MRGAEHPVDVRLAMTGAERRPTIDDNRATAKRLVFGSIVIYDTLYQYSINPGTSQSVFLSSEGVRCYYSQPLHPQTSDHPCFARMPRLTTLMSEVVGGGSCFAGLVCLRRWMLTCKHDASIFVGRQAVNSNSALQFPAGPVAGENW